MSADDALQPLLALVEDAAFRGAKRALEERFNSIPTPTEPSALLARGELALRLGCSIATVDRLVSEGCPNVYLNRTRRFDLARVREWLDAREPPNPNTMIPKLAPTVSLAGVRGLSRRTPRG